MALSDPEDLLFQAMNNLLKYLAAIITPWISLFTNQLNKGDCALLMTDSTTAEGWMRKTIFNKVGVNPLQASVQVNAAQQYACLFMDAYVKGYSQ